MSNKDAHIRLSKSVDFLRLNGVSRTQQELAEALGYSRANVSAAINGNPRYLTESFLQRFAKTYSDYINEDWLINGKGEMTKTDKNKMRPHIPSELAVVSAGFEGKAIGSVSEGECELHPVMTPFPWYDFTITVEGDSMEPELRDGDVIACQWLESSEELRPNKIYVVDSAEGAVVKQLDNTGKELVCRSINPLYKEFTIQSSNVLRIARVIGLIRNL